MLAALVFVVAASAGQSIAPAIDLAPERLSPGTCDGDSCRSDDRNRYRLPLPVDEPANPADRAFDEDGRKCGLIGRTVCTSKPHLIIGTGEHADDSLTEKLRQLDE